MTMMNATSIGAIAGLLSFITVEATGVGAGVGAILIPLYVGLIMRMGDPAV